MPGLPGTQEGEAVLLPHLSLTPQLLLGPGAPWRCPFHILRVLLTAGCTIHAGPGRCCPHGGRGGVRARVTSAPDLPASAAAALPLVLHNPVAHVRHKSSARC